jgi:hypothetical protein
MKGVVAALRKEEARVGLKEPLIRRRTFHGGRPINCRSTWLLPMCCRTKEMKTT